MKPLVIRAYALVLLFILFASIPLAAQQVDKAIIDTTHEIIADDYPVTNKMFEAYKKDNGEKIKSGEIYSGDIIWFTNHSLNQALAFELYTDNFRNVIYHFLNDDVPKDLINKMDLSNTDGFPVSKVQRIKYFKGFLNKARSIKEEYFKSKKGFVLGDPKEKAIKEYGKPDKVSSSDGVDKYEWTFEGDIGKNEKSGSKGKPFASESFGFEVTIFCRNNKIIAIILYNDIP